MLNLVISLLAIGSFYVNGVNQSDSLEAHYSQSQQVAPLYYSFDSMGSDIPADGDFVFTTDVGSIGFTIIPNHSYVSGQHSYDIQFKVLNESVYSNFYLYNLHAWYMAGSGSTLVNGNSYLPNVYFNGQTEYYVDNEDGEFTIQFNGPQDNPALYLDFDIGILPKEYFDGSQFNDGYWKGYDAGFRDGDNGGYEDGYRDGYTEGQGAQMNPEMFTIFNGILNVAMVPVNVFLKIFNWEVFGINIASLVTSILSVAILIIVIKLITGKSSGGD